MRTYLVTGGAGFIGSNYIHYMFKKYGNEIRIINVDALTYAGNLENLKDVEELDHYTFIKADICDRDAIDRIFSENDIDRVVHFAAESHVDRSITGPAAFVETNLVGTFTLLEAARQYWQAGKPAEPCRLVLAKRKGRPDRNRGGPLSGSGPISRPSARRRGRCGPAG